MSCKGFIFDMDGTLLDSMGMWRGLATVFLADHGLSPREEGLNSRVYQLSILEKQRLFEGEYGLKFPDLDSFRRAYYQATDKYYRRTIEPLPYVMDFLKRAKAEKIRMCVATSTPTAFACPALERLGITEFMEFVLCCNDVGAGKDKPDIYLEAARRLGCSVSECVVFEDALFCIETARKAGFRTVGIYEKNAPWDEEAARQLATRYIKGYEELLDIPVSEV